ncbi:ATP-dependent serine protease [Tenacibaculum maritimum]|uniref:ATP-dependent serine protease n=1 Tax=Tenacibaculum maritimum TaxID=107401 RepID=UPI0004096FF3|nr:ATP-dependent serine protease [Tenacibaculum maritimum]MDB0599822.1 ATP-binding protein [Tenacibaculum maritimum]MDB0610932.1 ATP-binding protein [Tenacibaculum maritimum]
MKKIKKAYGISDIEKMKFTRVKLSGNLGRHLGEMERSGSMLIYGGSGQGKTTYALKLAKGVCQEERVIYNTAEEGIKASWQRSLQLNNMKLVAGKFTFVKEGFDVFFERIKQKKQPKVAIIDSVQYFFRGKKVEDYFNLIETCNDVLFIFLSHIKHNEPKGAIAEEILWDCQNRILVENFKAYVEKSRCGGDETLPYIINERKANERELKLLRKG